MPEPIASLTPEQAALLPGVVESWRRTGLATARIDPAAARGAVREFYRAAGLREPRAIICLGSPAACLIARAILASLLRHTRRAFPSFYASFYDRDLHKHLCEDLDEPFSIRVWRATWTQLQQQIGEAQWRPLVAQFSDLDGDQLRSFIRLPDSVAAQALHQLAAPLHELLIRRTFVALRPESGPPVDRTIDTQIQDDFRPNIDRSSIDRRDERRPGAFLRRASFGAWQGPCLTGGGEAWLAALYDFAERIGVQYDTGSKRLWDAYKDCVGNCGWLYAFGSVAFVSDRPSEMHFDAQRRLHHAAGAAVRYGDGWSAYAWHGTAVPGWLIEERDSITPEMIDALPHAHVRHAALEIYGYDRFLAAREARVVAADELHGQPRRLLEVSVGGFPFRIVAVVNGSREPDGTRLRFHLAAMPGDTPADVIAASYGIARAHYREAVRT